MSSSLKRERQLARERYERQQARRRAAAARRRRLQQIGAVVVAIAVVVAGVVGLGVALDGGDDAEVATKDTSSPTPTSASPSPTSAEGCTYSPAGEAARKVETPTFDEASASRPGTATIVTNRGTVEITLAAEQAPCTVNSFRHLASQKYFDDTSCHRLTTDNIFVLQCGDPTGTGSGGPGYQFGEENVPADAENNYPAGTVAMANAGAGTNGSQFFLVYKDTTLPPNYTIFGTITGGLDVVEKVAAAGSDDSNGPGDGKPKKPVTIERVRIGKA